MNETAANRYSEREADWRKGAVVYQVWVDRFAPSTDLDAKRHLYPEPKRLRSWDEVPSQGHYIDDLRLWSHEIDFWGGDLASLRTRLDYIEELGADVVYLNPIHLSYTNHRYDALDYEKVAPEYGTRDDVRALADDVHGRGMKLMLDGVFNHIGRQSALFQAALHEGVKRDWFDFGDYPGGVRTWANAENLPELNLENPEVRAWEAEVIKSWLRDGVDGWRLDVAFDIGPEYLAELTAAAHEQLPGSSVVGEIASFCEGWFPSVDGMIQFLIRRILIGLAEGSIAPAHAQRMLERIYADADFEHMLMSWTYLDNHDQPRIAHALPDEARRRLAINLVHLLPGSVTVYYGSELGMSGGDDPEMRAPMRWDWVNDDNPWLAQTRQLIELRRSHRALRVGDLRWCETERLIGFERHTDQAREAVVVLANPTDQVVSERVLVPDWRLVAEPHLNDLLGGEGAQIVWGLVDVTLQPFQVVALNAGAADPKAYDCFKRV